MEQFGSGRAADTLETPALVSRGLLVALATPSVAALALPEGHGIAAVLRVIADLATLPAFFAVAGWLSISPFVAPRLLPAARSLLPSVLCGLAGAGAAFALAPLAGLERPAGLAQAAPAWTLALLPPLYAILARALRSSPILLCALAILAHVAGVVLALRPLVDFVFFVAGLALAARQRRLVQLVRDEPEFAMAAGPLAFVLAAAVAVRFGQTGQAPSLAAVGPIALALGLAAGPSVLASASALSFSRPAEPLIRLGRAAPALAIFWLPLYFALIAAANRGLAPSFTSAFLMAVASLLLVSVVADMSLDMAEKAGFPRAAAHS